MSTDPVRLTEDGLADPMQRELLGQLRSMPPPAGAEAQVWLGLQRQIALAAAVGITATVAPKAAAAVNASVVGKTLLTKVVLGVSLGVVGAGSAYVTLHSR